MGTDRIITLTDTATIRIAQANSALSLKGQVKGTGYLVKDGAGQLNFTYGGANNFAGVIVKKGVIAQGAWNSTFGKSGSPMVLEGGEVHQINVNSTSAVPVLDHQFTVVEGTTNKIVGSSRGRINGSFQGGGNLTIQTRYVRCDIGADFSRFEGRLTATNSDGNFRLMSNVTDMSKARLLVDAGTTVSHVQSGGNNAVTATLKIGSLSSTSSSATNGVLGGSGSTYEIGALGDNTTFYGLFTAAKIVKVGDGKLTLRTAGHTSPITVSEGTLELYNGTSTVMTSGLLTVEKSGLLTGTALVQSVTVKKGGTVKGGLLASNSGALRVNGNLSLQSGATTLVTFGASSGNSRITVSGRITHNADTLLLQIPEGRQLSVGDEIVVYTAGFTAATGDVIVKCQSEDAVYEFDTSLLNSDGKLLVVCATSGMDNLQSGDVLVDVFSVDGLLLRKTVNPLHALDGLPSGGYVLGKRINGRLVGRKVVKVGNR